MTPEEHKSQILKEVDFAMSKIGGGRSWRTGQIAFLLKEEIKDRINDERKKSGLPVIDDETQDPDYIKMISKRASSLNGSNGNGKH